MNERNSTFWQEDKRPYEWPTDFLSGNSIHTTAASQDHLLASPSKAGLERRRRRTFRIRRVVRWGGF